jgi:hypothetical protein
MMLMAGVVAVEQAGGGDEAHLVGRAIAGERLEFGGQVGHGGVNVREGAPAHHAVDQCGRGLLLEQKPDDFLREPVAFGGLPAGAATQVQDFHDLSVSSFFQCPCSRGKARGRPSV